MNVNKPVQKVELEADTSTLEISSHGTITGIIAIRVGETLFPGANWSDFPVVILIWWLEPVSRILQGKSRVWECRFMDGPFLARLEQQSEDIWKLSGFHNEHIEFTAAISCREFIHSLLRVANLVLSECNKRGWTNRDTEALGSAIRIISTWHLTVIQH